MQVKDEFLKKYKEYAQRYADIYPFIYEDIDNIKFEEIQTQNEVIIEIEKNQINIEIQISNTDFPRNIFISSDIKNIEELKNIPYLLTIRILDEKYNLNNFNIDYYLYNEDFFGNLFINGEKFRFHTTEQFKHYFEELRTKQNIGNF